MQEIEEFKVWVFYLKAFPNKVYAYTTLKEYKDKFLKVRNPNVFRIEKLVMDEFEFSLFANENRKQKLNEYPLSYGTKADDYAIVLLTDEEEGLLEAYSSNLVHEMENLYRSLILHSSLRKRYREAIEYLTDTTYDLEFPSGITQMTSRLSMLSAFSKLFQNTLRKGT